MEEEFSIDEHKFQKNNSLRQDSDFFNDEDNVVYDVISVKHKKQNKEESWEISKNKEVVLILKGTRFTAKEREYFETIDGIKYIINGYKCGWKSTSEFKRNLKGLL